MKKNQEVKEEQIQATGKEVGRMARQAAREILGPDASFEDVVVLASAIINEGMAIALAEEREATRTGLVATSVRKGTRRKKKKR